MSKEYIEAFKTIKIKCHPNSNPSPLVDSALEVVEQALQRLEAIDNAKPSEALKCLERLDIAVRYSTIDDEGYSLKEPRKMTNICDGEFNTIKQALLKAQEQEKVLEIIKEKNVDIIRIRHLIFKSQKNPKYWDLRYYNEARVIDDEKLTQEEFELLKEAFK